MLEIDGTYGEGGGQILRSALTLALITGRAFHLRRVRAGRAKPGLRPQHLQAVRAAAEIGRAMVRGGELESQDLIFEPGPVRPGHYEFDIGTAGAASLVLQTLLVPLGLGSESSTVRVVGGTHVPWSPCFHYLDRQWCHHLEQIGFRLNLKLVRPGFYPPGGGCIAAEVAAVETLRAQEWTRRGQLLDIEVLSAAANLPEHVIERQRDQARRRLAGLNCPLSVRVQRWEADSPGTLLVLLARFEHSQACFFALGARGKPAERVADEAVEQLLAFIGTGAVVDEYLADQILVPLALAGPGSVLRTARVTQHLLTNAWVVQQFLPVAIRVGGSMGTPADVRIEAQHDRPRRKAAAGAAALGALAPDRR